MLKEITRLPHIALTFLLFVTCFNHSESHAQVIGENPRLLQPSDLIYKGAFRLPLTQNQYSKWESGGTALAYRPNGDASGPNDGYPGSLFGVGSDKVPAASEVSIPAPIISLEKNALKLNVAKTIQPFGDITGGFRDKVDVDTIGGLAYLEPSKQQPTEKLYWSIHEYYNVAGIDFLSHGRSSTNIAKPNPEGVWHLGPKTEKDKNSPFHSMKTGDYMFTIPRLWADVNLGGEYLATGRVREAGTNGSSQGPAIFSFAPNNYESSKLSHGAEIKATPLLYYPFGAGHMPNYLKCDHWNGGAWLTGNEGKEAVVITGRKSLGEERYGPAIEGDCFPYKGYHCSPYESQILFYDPEDLAQVAKGNKKPWESIPYATFRPQKYFWPSCPGSLGGTTFDRKRKLLYVVQLWADKQTNPYEDRPLVHVFQIGNSIDKTPPSSPDHLQIQ